MLYSTFPDTTAIDGRADRTAPTGQHRGLFTQLPIPVENPWVAGLTGFFTTAFVLLPLEYEAPPRSAMLFLSTRRF